MTLKNAFAQSSHGRARGARITGRFKNIETETLPLDEFLTSNGFTSEIGPPMAYDQYGNYYTTLITEGPREEGETEYLRVRATTKKLAVATYEKSLFKFLGTNRHIIWRIQPEINGVSNGLIEEWKVYSRLTVYRTGKIIYAPDDV